MTPAPSQYVQPEVSDARVNRLWSRVSAQLEPRRARAWRWLLLGSAFASVASGAVLFAAGQSPSNMPAQVSTLAEAKLETANDPLGVTLADGSKLALESRTEVRVRGNQANATALSLGLVRGKVVCDVTHLPGRRFTVVAGDVEVRVIGTKFSVETSAGDNPSVAVSVLRGVVEVTSRRHPGIVARVAAGESWLQAAKPSLPAPSTTVEPQRTETPGGEAEASGEATDPTKRSPALPSVAAASGPSARDLFEKAGESRRAGNAADAARAYEELLRLHPSDGRASLSAFELGRLRMDRLNDAAGAITALERALALNIGPSFREDALARLVSIYASQGKFAACGHARDRYLSSYPAGVHATAVATRCGSR